MLFESRRQSIRILSMMLFLVGSSLVANCQAERNPILPVTQSYCQQLIDAESEEHLAAFLRERERNQQLWAEFKLFANEQAASAKQQWARLDFESWRVRLSRFSVLPSAKQQPAKVTGTRTISATAMGVSYVANTTALQWWQTSNLAADLLNRGHQRVAQEQSKFEAELQSSLLQWVEATSSNIIKVANSRQVSGIIQAVLVSENSSSPDAELLLSIESTDEDPVADPYWQYYADFDFWGAQFEVEEK